MSSKPGRASVKVIRVFLWDTHKYIIQPWSSDIHGYFSTFFIDPPSEGVSSGYESMRCESSANIHSSDSSSEKGKSPMSKGKRWHFMHRNQQVV